MRTLRTLGLAALAGLGLASSAQAVYTLDPLVGFGGADAWFAPAEGGYQYLGTANLERGLAYNPVSDKVYVVSRANPSGGVGTDTNIRILDPLTGADTGFLNTGVPNVDITGGTFKVSMIGVGDDGAIYASNLSTALATPFKIYKWANDAAAVTTFFNATSGLPRTGDTFDVIGSGVNTKFIASGTGSDGFALIQGAVPTSSVINVAGDAVGDYRLGITFLDAGRVYGTQAGAPGSPIRLVDLAGPSLLGSPASTSAAERPLDYIVVGGVALLATIDCNSSLVRIYDVTNPLAPVFIDDANNTSGTLVANGNGLGQVKFGKVTGNTVNLYAMSTNQGIQAFSFTVPEPTTLAVLGLATAGLIKRRRA